MRLYIQHRPSCGKFCERVRIDVMRIAMRFPEQAGELVGRTDAQAGHRQEFAGPAHSSFSFSAHLPGCHAAPPPFSLFIFFLPCRLLLYPCLTVCLCSSACPTAALKRSKLDAIALSLALDKVDAALFGGESVVIAKRSRYDIPLCVGELRESVGSFGGHCGTLVGNLSLSLRAGQCTSQGRDSPAP